MLTCTAGMIGLTDTTSQQIFEIKRPGQSHVIFDLSPSAANLHTTRITLPVGSRWTPGPHWHERHTEFLRVLEGRVILKLNGESKVVTCEDGLQTVERFVTHEWMRADIDEPDADKDGEIVVVEESTDPMDGEKHVFFSNLFSTIIDAKAYWKRLTTLQILLTCAEYDNFEVIVPGRLSYAITHLTFVIVRIVAKLLRLKPWYAEYTPPRWRGIAKHES